MKDRADRKRVILAAIIAIIIGTIVLAGYFLIQAHAWSKIRIFKSGFSSLQSIDILFHASAAILTDCETCSAISLWFVWYRTCWRITSGSLLEVLSIRWALIDVDHAPGLSTIAPQPFDVVPPSTKSRSTPKEPRLDIEQISTRRWPID